MPHIGSFCEERRRGLTYVSHVTEQTHLGRKILHLEANLSNPRGCACDPFSSQKNNAQWCQKVPLSSRLEGRWYELRPRKAGGGAFPSPLPSHGETNLKDDVDG